MRIPVILNIRYLLTLMFAALVISAFTGSTQSQCLQHIILLFSRGDRSYDQLCSMSNASNCNNLVTGCGKTLEARLPN